MANVNMTLAEAKQIVADVLAQHGDEIELRDFLAALPEGQRAKVGRLLTELRRKGEIKKQIEVNTQTGEKSHRIRITGEFAPKFPQDSSGGDA